jgi:FtsH-binding integral membrane protein
MSASPFALMFGAMSVYGMVTKTDLSRLGSILFMALIGLIIASLVNMFFANSALDWLISFAGVVIFAGLTAWDTQKLKQIAITTANDAAMAARLSVNGALMLYTTCSLPPAIHGQSAGLRVPERMKDEAEG